VRQILISSIANNTYFNVDIKTFVLKADQIGLLNR